MKTVSIVLLLVVGAFLASAGATPYKENKGVLLQGKAADGSVTRDKTITKVVKMLQNMLDKSKEEGDSERERYAKFKCYCDSNEEEKKASIASLTEDIAMLQTKIESLQGSNGKLSSQCAKLKADMATNENAREEAAGIRQKEAEAFVAEEADLTGAIGQMKQAIAVLAGIGADQTLNAAEDHKKFMAGVPSASLVKLKTTVKAALVAALSLMPPKQATTLQAFLQAPFTGNYASQSGKIVGILKNMLDTFEQNLESAKSTEAEAIKSNAEFMKVKQEEHGKMSASYEEKQTFLSANDGELASSKEQLTVAKNDMSSDEAFLAELLPMCETRAKEYEHRKMLRANEQAAISEAIAILNSDAAFETFGSVDATSTGATKATLLQKKHVSFLQTNSNHIYHLRIAAQQQLQKAAKAVNSVRLAKVATSIQAGNPFEEVLSEIERIMQLIDEESKADKNNLAWCNSEREANNAENATKTQEILGLTTDITDLDATINDPETGLKSQIKATEESLVQNTQSQTSETEIRKEENQAYQKDIKVLVESERLLKKAMKVLQKYYDSILQKMEATLLQKKEDPAPPETWEGEYSGQSEAGSQVIEMLQFILSEAEKEETDAHDAENNAQIAYEDSMSSLKQQETSQQKSLASLQKELADSEKELLEKHEDLANTKAAKKSIEDYLLKIKPGCDFITENYDIRESHRIVEKTSLENAIELIKGTPAYTAATAEAHMESLGECKDKCADEEDVTCKACLAKTSVAGYCAGHPDTTGC